MRILFLVFFLILYSCNSIPKGYLVNNDICHYNNSFFKITKGEMTFDIEKHNNALEKGDLVLVDNSNFKNVFYKWEGDSKITNRQTNKLLNVEKLIKYDKNGKILFSYFKYLNGSKEIGKETYYNQQGNITKIIDYEKGYKICWAEAIEIVKKIAKKDIKKYKIKEFYAVHNNLNEFPNVNPQWYIGFMNGNEKFKKHKNKKGSIRYVIDGITGKFIKTYRITIEHY